MKTLQIILLVLAAVCSSGRCDTPRPTSVRVFASPDGGALVRIVPRDASGERARAIVLKYDARSGGYRQVTEFALRNPVAPAEVIVCNDARFIVTFDDWGELGSTENVVVVYRTTGELMKSWRLTDIFSEEECAKFQRSISSIWWRGDVSLLELSAEVRWVQIRLDGWTVGSDNHKRELILDLSDLSLRKG